MADTRDWSGAAIGLEADRSAHVNKCSGPVRFQVAGVVARNRLACGQSGASLNQLAARLWDRATAPQDQAEKVKAGRKSIITRLGGRHGEENLSIFDGKLKSSRLNAALF